MMAIILDGKISTSVWTRIMSSRSGNPVEGDPHTMAENGKTVGMRSFVDQIPSYVKVSWLVTSS